MNNHLLRFFRKHSSALLCLLASGGVVTTAVLAARNAPKANELLKKAAEEKEEKLTTLEKIRIAAPAYIPAIVSGATTIICLFSANVLDRKYQASLAGAYGLISSQYKRYSQKVRELCGEEVHKTVMDSIAVEKAEEVTISAPSFFGSHSLEVNDVKEEKLLFYDPFSERYFESTLSRVIQAEYHLNRNLTLGSDVTLNDFYLFLGLDKIESGDDLGWSWYEDDIPWIDFEHTTSQLDDGTPYVMISIIFGPMALYEQGE